METSVASKKTLVIIALLSLVTVSILALTSLCGSQTKLAVCNSKGTLITYMRLRNSFDVVINTGSDSTVSSCLGAFMPFYDKKIELLVFTSTKNAYLKGSSNLLDRYSVGKIILPYQEGDSTIALKRIYAHAKRKKIPVLQIQDYKLVPLLEGQLMLNPLNSHTTDIADTEVKVAARYISNRFEAIFLSKLDNTSVKNTVINVEKNASYTICLDSCNALGLQFESMGDFNEARMSLYSGEKNSIPVRHAANIRYVSVEEKAMRELQIP